MKLLVGAAIAFVLAASFAAGGLLADSVAVGFWCALGAAGLLAAGGLLYHLDQALQDHDGRAAAADALGLHPDDLEHQGGMWQPKDYLIQPCDICGRLCLPRRSLLAGCEGALFWMCPTCIRWANTEHPTPNTASAGGPE